MSRRKRPSLEPQRRWAILQRDNFTCAYCGARPGNDKLEVDHIVPVSRRGSDHDANLVTACARCNQGKSDSISVPASMCTEPRNAEGWTTWRTWGEWKLEWCETAIYLDYRNSYAIDLRCVHEPDWLEHAADQEWPIAVRLSFGEALAFARLLVVTPLEAKQR